MAIITISRQYGTGGINIGRKIAEKLNYRFIYLDELIAGCKERGLDIDLERIEGRPPKLIERLFLLDRIKVQDTIKDVMKNAAQGDNVVIGGWGSLRGATIGAMLIAFFEVGVASISSQPLAEGLLYVAVLLVLLVRPDGIFGEPQRLRA